MIIVWKKNFRLVFEFLDLEGFRMLLPVTWVFHFISSRTWKVRNFLFLFLLKSRFLIIWIFETVEDDNLGGRRKGWVNYLSFFFFLTRVNASWWFLLKCNSKVRALQSTHISGKIMHFNFLSVHVWALSKTFASIIMSIYHKIRLVVLLDMDS